MTKQREVINALKHAVREQFAWPGGYALFGVTSDGAALCRKCLKKEYKNILQYTRWNQPISGWCLDRISNAAWLEDDTEACDHCNAPLTV